MNDRFCMRIPVLHMDQSGREETTSAESDHFVIMTHEVGDERVD